MGNVIAKRVTSLVRGVRRWFNLGLEEDQLADGDRWKRVELMFARDNLSLMPTMCVGASVILLLLMLSRAQIHGYTVWNTTPFLVGIAICIACALLSRSALKEPTQRKAICLVDTVTLTWYVLAIYSSLVLQPEKPCVLLCLMIAAIPLLFDEPPKRMIPMALLVYAMMVYTEFALVPESVRHTDFNNSIIALAIGVGCGQMKSAAKVKGQTYLEMFKTASKTLEVVVQVDLRRNSLEMLKAPNSKISTGTSRHEANKVIPYICMNFVAPEFRAAFLSFFDLATLPERMGEKKQITFEYMNVSGVWNQITIVEERRWEGKVSAVVAVVRNVDAEKRQELEYRRKLQEAAAEAERANVAKSNFLRRMSHDIRTPINGIRGITKIGEYYADDLEKQTDCRRKVIEASDYLTLLVDNILDMSKLESGVVELEEKPFNIQTILNNVALVSRTQATNFGIRFSLSASDADIPYPNLIGSPIHLQQVLHNLTSNAVKYNRKGGSISVSCKESECIDGTVWVHLVVSDTGLGMSEEFIARAFEPFSQAQDERANGTYVGSGLGLSIVKEFTESMGGTVELNSKLDVGTSFILRIPFKVDTSPAAEEDAFKQVDLKGKKALVAEDNELNLEIIEFILREQGLQTVAAHNGEEAVRLFDESEEGSFDVVFLDIMMPVMDGLQAAQAIRALGRNDSKSVPIFAMTANAFRDDMERSYEAGINEHLTKPLESARVAEALQRWLR